MQWAMVRRSATLPSPSREITGPGRNPDCTRELEAKPDLKARGVEFEDYDMPGEKSPSRVVTAGGAKAAWFKDTDGNILAIIQSA
jgi:hypothetical protein